MLVTTDAAPVTDPLEQYLQAQIDRLRDEAEVMDPHEALRRFEGLLGSLPEGASGVLRFRVKANIGHRHLALGKRDEAGRWLLEAFEEAPEDSRAITNRALGLWAQGDDRAAYDYAVGMVAADPSNEALASYIPQIAAVLPEVDDGLDHVPAALRDTEALVLAQALFLRGRDRRPEWWTFAREAAARHPGSKHLRVLKAFSEIDEIARDERLQTTMTLTDRDRATLGDAADVLDAYWQSKAAMIGNRYDDVQHALAASMVARHLRDEEELVVAQASRIADEALDNPQIVAQALHVAIDWGQLGLADRLAMQLPNDPDVSFHRGILAVRHGDWEGAAFALAMAKVPDEDRTLVDTVLALGELKRRGVDEAGLEGLIPGAKKCARSLVMVSRAAAQDGHEAIASDAFGRAKALIGPNSHIASRLMVASLAVELGTQADVIELLDGKLPPRGFDREHFWLSRAHVSERPHRPRNIAYFEGLPKHLQEDPAIARAHASVLLDIGQAPRAKAILRRIYDGGERDSYVTMRLLEAYRKTDDAAAAAELLRTADVGAGTVPENDMALASEIAASGESLRAYRIAYDVVRRHPDRGDVAMGYVGLHLLREAGGAAFSASTAGRDACVTIEGPGGDIRTFVIDEGPEFFGIEVEAPTGPMARLVEGKREGDAISLPSLAEAPDTRRVALVRSKYLHLHLLIMDGFQARFPETPGIVKFEVGDDIGTVKKMVRRRAEHSDQMARFYFERGVPMEIVSKLVGGDPVGFAGYVRSIGGEIATVSGLLSDLTAGMALAEGGRHRGIALDAYAVFTAAEIDVLDALKATFGELHVPQSAVDMVERMIARENDGLGKEQMTVGWFDGEYLKEITTDEQRRARIELLERLSERIGRACTCQTALAPNESSGEIEAMLEAGGPNFLDAAFLAKQHGAILVSEDAHYRDWARRAGAPDGIWLQAALLSSLSAGALPPTEYAEAVVQLAARRHGHVCVNEAVLYKVCAADEDGLPRFRATLHYLAGPTAEVLSHYRVIRDLLRLIWSNRADLSALRRRAATGAVLEAILKGRKDDWRHWIDNLMEWGPRVGHLQTYIRQWLFGHFLLQPADPAPGRVKKSERSRGRRAHRGR